MKVYGYVPIKCSAPAEKEVFDFLLILIIVIAAFTFLTSP